jgi:drug/metabolite transporter (DMT)-like permease
MNGHLTFAQIAILSAYALGLSGGQLLFKLAAARFAGTAPVEERAISVVLSWSFLSALVLYFALSLLWVWILSFTPLSRAYPFVALAFAITPVLGGLLFAEQLSVRLVAGIAVILAGLVLVAG